MAELISFGDGRKLKLGFIERNGDFDGMSDTSSDGENEGEIVG